MINRKVAWLVLIVFLLAEMSLASALTVGYYAKFVNFDPAITTSTADFLVVRQVYEPLIKYQMGSLEPWLATSWEWISNTELVVKLREGVFFHNGAELTADDVVFTFERMKPYNTGYTWLFDKIESIKRIDKFTVKFILNAPYPMLPYALTTPVASILPQTEDIDFSVAAVGTGPFKFVEWEVGQRVVLERYNRYWDKPAAVHKVEIKPIVDSTARLVALRSGAVDMIAMVPYAAIPQLKGNYQVVVAHLPGNFQLAFNFRGGEWNQPVSDPFEDVLVRKAISYAIDYDELIALTANTAKRLYGPLPPGVPGYPEDMRAVERYTYDLEMAKRLMAQSSVPKGFSTVLLAPPEYAREAVLVQGYLKKIGIDAEVKVWDWGAIIPVVRQPNAGDGYGMFLYSRSMMAPFPPMLMRMNLSTYGWKPNAYFDIAYDLLYDDVESRPVEEQIQIYEALYRFIVDRRISAYIYDWVCPWAASAEIEGFDQTAFLFEGTPLFTKMSKRG